MNIITNISQLHFYINAKVFDGQHRLQYINKSGQDAKNDFTVCSFGRDAEADESGEHLN